jgi:hypothetical protein
MEIVGSYIQYAEGYNKDNINKDDVLQAIENLKDSDDEHDGFWVGVYGKDTEEIVLETNKWFEVFFHLNDEKDTFYTTRLKGYEEIKTLYELLIDGKIQEIENKMIEYKAKKNQN